MTKSIISNASSRNRSFFVVPCHERVRCDGRRGFRTEEKVIYIRKSVLLNIIRQSVADKNLYDEVMAILMARMRRK